MSRVDPEKIAEKVKHAEDHGGVLDLNACSLDVECARRLSLVLEASKLDRLILSNNEIGDPGVVYLAPSLTNNLHLHRLVLTGNSIGDDGVAALSSALIVNRHLRHLDLHDNLITEAGAQSVARLLRYTHHLEELKLGSNAIGDAGVRICAAAIRKNHRGKLATLGLSSNNITDVGARKLKQLVEVHEHTITGMELGFNPIKDERIKDDIKAACVKNKKHSALKSWKHDSKKKRAKGGGAADVAKLTPAQKSELSAAFAMFDKDGDGTIEAEELGLVLKECYGEEPDKAQLEAMIIDADEDESGVIEKDEFMQMMARQMAGSESESESSSSDEEEGSDDELLKAAGLFDKVPGTVRAAAPAAAPTPRPLPVSPPAEPEPEPEPEPDEGDLEDLDDLEALDVDGTDNPLAVSEGVPPAPAPAPAPTRERAAGEQSLDSQRERVRARLAASKAQKASAQGKGKTAKQAKPTPEPQPQPAPAPEPAAAKRGKGGAVVDPNVKASMANLE